MNYDKDLKITQKKSKVQWWRKGLIWGLIFSFGMLSFACKKQSEEENSDEYYVQYEVYSTTIYYGGKLDATINTENNQSLTLTINQRQQWETIIGPVKKGFNASLNVEATGNTNNKLRLYTKISVSKNGSPFALKKTDGSDTPRDNVQLNYTVDY